MPGQQLVTKSFTTPAAGASVNDFHLGGYTPSAVLPPSQLTFLDKRADYTAGVLSAAFTLNLSAADAAQTAEFNIIYSQGPLDANGGLQPHPVRSAEPPLECFVFTKKIGLAVLHTYTCRWQTVIKLSGR
jgi:hypothetical protein